MKKVILSAVVLAGVLFVACSSNKAIEEQKALLTSSIAKIDSIKTMDQFQAYLLEYNAADSAFRAQNAEALTAEISEEDAAVITSLNSQWLEKIQAKGDSLVSAQISSSTVVE